METYTIDFLLFWISPKQKLLAKWNASIFMHSRRGPHSLSHLVFVEADEPIRGYYSCIFSCQGLLFAFFETLFSAEHFCFYFVVYPPHSLLFSFL